MTVKDHTAKPFINVTPLIDVLLVLLIIFMVVTPLRPARILAKIPSPPDDRRLDVNIDTLVVTIKEDRTLMLNGLTDMGSVNDMSRVRETLADLFQRRRENHVYRDEMIGRLDLADELRIEKTVFIKAPRSIPYGEVARVVDGVKGSGASPLGLQIDNLN
jgi:biopolymer transport protein ExbD